MHVFVYSQELVSMLGGVYVFYNFYIDYSIEHVFVILNIWVIILEKKENRIVRQIQYHKIIVELLANQIYSYLFVFSFINSRILFQMSFQKTLRALAITYLQILEVPVV